jgi:hypothetical protein
MPGIISGDFSLLTVAGATDGGRVQRRDGIRVALSSAMRFALAALAAVHGLIHLMGFARAFGYGNVPLTLPVSKAAGIAWLTAAVLWLVAAAMLAVASERWWIVGAVALVLSQALVFSAWSDAKFGTVANLILLIPIAVTALARGPWGVSSRFDRAMAEAKARAVASDRQPVTESDIARLPPDIRQYLRFTGAVGRPRVDNYRVSFSGAFREGPADGWMPARARQFSQVHPAARWFTIRATNHGVPFDALHTYTGAHATFEVRVATLGKVVDAHGPEMDVSETVTLFNDMCLLAPATLIDPAIVWEEIDPATVRATFTNAGHTISAVLSFDADGALTNFVSSDRYRSADGKTFERLPWSTPVTRYAQFDGRRVATDAEARWTPLSGAFPYARFTVTDVAYNVD